MNEKIADKDLWVVDTIVKLENAVDGVINLDVGGVKITAELSQALLKFFKENKSFLIKLGQSGFSDFLYLIQVDLLNLTNYYHNFFILFYTFLYFRDIY